MGPLSQEGPTLNKIEAPKPTCHRTGRPGTSVVGGRPSFAFSGTEWPGNLRRAFNVGRGVGFGAGGRYAGGGSSPLSDTLKAQVNGLGFTQPMEVAVVLLESANRPYLPSSSWMY